MFSHRQSIAIVRRPVKEVAVVLNSLVASFGDRSCAGSEFFRFRFFVIFPILFAMMAMTSHAQVTAKLKINAKVLPGGSSAPMLAPAALLSVTTPVVQTSTREAEISFHLGNDADPATFKVMLQNIDITDQVGISGCFSVPCDITVKVSATGTLKAGSNIFNARVSGHAGNTQSARARVFSTQSGVSSASTAERNGVSPALVGDPSLPNALPHYIPISFNANGNVYYSENGSIQQPLVGCDNVTMVILDRTNMFIGYGICASDYATLTGGLTFNKDELIFIWTKPGVPLPKWDFSPFGGTDFTQPNAPTVYGYSMIGYGDAFAGEASESYQTSPTAPWVGVFGQLVNISSTGTKYAFQSEETPAFAILPGKKNSTVTIGNVQSFPTGSGGKMPNGTLPQGFGTGYTTFTSPTMEASSQGGMWVLVLDRKTLGQVSSTIYETNCASGCSKLGFQAASDFSNDVSNLAIRSPGNPLVFIATVGDPVPGDSSVVITGITKGLGVSNYAIVSASAPGAVFSMIGAGGAIADPGGFEATETNAPVNSGAEKWYSSTADTQQGDTGAIHGYLVRNSQFNFTPDDVAPYTQANPPDTSSTDALFAGAISRQVGLAQAVTWPMSDTIAHLEAYIYLSQQLIKADFYGGGDCLSGGVACQDIRTYYTSDEVPSIINGDSPLAIPYVSNTVFTAQDQHAIAQQLEYEKAYLGNVKNYEDWLIGIHTNASINMSSSLQAAASDVANQLNQATGLPIPQVDQSPVGFLDSFSQGADSANLNKLEGWVDLFNSGAALASAAAPIADASGPEGSTAVAVTSGVLWSASALLQEFNDSSADNLPGAPPVDPYVNQLSDLLADSNGNASRAANRINEDMESSTGVFFDGIYSDWFKLQTIGLMTVNPSATGWFIQDAGAAATSYIPEFTVSSRRSLYLQTLGQYFATTRALLVPEQCYLNMGWSQTKIDQTAASLNSARLETTDYGWDRRTSYSLPQYAAVDDDYVFVYLQSTAPYKNGSVNFAGAKPWTSTFGDTLMAAPTEGASDGLGNLNLSRNFLYDTALMPDYYGDAGIGNSGSCALEALPPGSAVNTSTQLRLNSNEITATENVVAHVTITAASSSTATLSGIVTITSGGSTIANTPLSVTASQNSLDFTLSGSSFAAGQNSLTATFTSNNDSYNSSSSVAAGLTIGKPAFTLSVSSSAVTIADGNPASVNLTVNPMLGFTGPVSFSCSGLPAGVACVFADPQVTITDKAVKTELTLTNGTTVQQASFVVTGSVVVLSCGLLCFNIGKRRKQWLLCMVLIAGITSLATGCGTSAHTPASTAQQYSVTVIGTSGSTTQSQEIQLLVK